MTGSRLLTLAMAIVFPLSALVYSTGRLTRATQMLRTEVAESFERLVSAIAAVDSKPCQ